MAKAKGGDVLDEAQKPCPRRLTQPVERPREKTDSIWLLRILKAGGLVAVDALGEVAMQEGVGDVELMCRPVLAGDEHEHGADCRWFDHRRERLLEVDAGSLMKATDNPPGFVTLEGAVGVQFVLEHPLAGDDLGISRTRYERPCAVVLESIELELHCCSPVRITQRGTDGGRHWG